MKFQKRPKASVAAGFFIVHCPIKGNTVP